MIPKTNAVWYQGRRERAEQVGQWLRPDPALGPWACLELSEECAAGMRRWLLVRCDADDPDEHAYFLAFGPEGTAVAELVRVCITRWQIEEGFAQAKGEVGLDQYEVRKWEAWHRHATLCLLAHAYLVVLAKRRSRKNAGKRGRRHQPNPAHGAGGASAGPRHGPGCGAAAVPPCLVPMATQSPGGRCPLPGRAACAAPGDLTTRPRRTTAEHGRGGADRRRVAACRAGAATAEAHDGAAAPRPPDDARRHLVGGALRGLVAGDATGVRQVGNGVQAVPALVHHRSLAAHPCRVGPLRKLSVAVGTVQPLKKAA